VSTQATKHWNGLDGLRFFAALAVILTHLHSYDYFVSLGLGKYHRLVDGGTGVNLFYVLSGFLITSLAIKEIRLYGTFSIKDFFIRRSLRIFPLYYFALFCYVILHFFYIKRLNFDSFLHAFFYIYNFIPIDKYQGWLGSFHTLATEEHFYLVFPFLFFMTFRRSGLLFVALMLAYVLLVPNLRGYFAPYSQTYFVDRWTLFACVPILIGAIAAWINAQNSVDQCIVFLSRGKGSRLGLALVLLAPALYFYLIQPHAYSPVTMAVGFSFLVVFVVRFQSNWFVRAMSVQPLAYFGRISYGLYVWQSIVIGTGDGEGIFKSRWIAFFLVFLLAIISYELFENRFLKLKERFSRQPIHAQI